jgi:hypothetical protein
MNRFVNIYRCIHFNNSFYYLSIYIVIIEIMNFVYYKKEKQ